MNAVLAVARKEFRDDFRSRWTLAITVLFAVLALGIAYFGAAAAGRFGFVSFDATVASLTTLAAFVIPLIGLLIAYDTIVGERESGTLMLLLSYPVSRAQLIAGKFLGHSAMLATAAALGFGAAVALIQAMTPAARTLEAWRHVAVFIASASMLGATFAGVACLVSAIAREKARAAGLALMAWFALVIVFDLALLALLVVSGGNALERAVYPYLLLANPIDVFRLVNLLTLGEGAGNDVFMSMTAAHAYTPVLLGAAMSAWALGPFALALAVFRRQEI
ncbi:ABC transporter permease subunit [Trinickia caryophylli]|uniref:Cu-processing system permease protein n=1 Tax=Trinickia caryophylli TaxID=28094 RepID=A0A1X7FAF8_TRICW|nr:ABC transporter permease subunit [Trinickia caryophylli]PMS10944.1 ABC transporter permease [Trinickia caryophylli]TRX18891.1 ABC transporter permease [Trinickia caryophylli]WQE10311.1 ABC transporter permease subunit [Trinickia caryophylli]SMF49053.1 Cu-processing system permease protein [Trinickia caryophylli]GLU34242.1 membrane protein NosY [Trinickia caryophylli]